MTLRRIKLSVVVLIFCVLFLAPDVVPGLAQPTGPEAVRDCTGWVGCAKRSWETTCHDIFEDGFGNRYIGRGPCDSCIPSGNRASGLLEWCD
jgi:hypothetical protein